MVFCHECGQQNEDNTNFCIYCGVKIIKSPIKCIKCGKLNKYNSNFCINCGNNLFSQNIKNEKSENLISNNIQKNEYIKPTYEKANVITKQKIEKVKPKPSIYDKENEAQILSLNGEQDKAISIYKELIKESETYNDNVSHWYFEIANCYWFKREYDNAIAICEEEIKILKNFGKDYTQIKQRIERYEKEKRNIDIHNLEKNGETLYYRTKFDEAIKPLKEAIELGSTRYQTFKCLTNIYIRKKELNSAVHVLKIGIKRIKKEDREWSENLLHNEQNDGLKDILENISYCLEHGEFKRNCLPIDESNIKPKIQEAKSILINDNIKGIEMLEEILTNGTYNNTVYYTLYQNYNKDKKFNDSIRICKKAIDMLGFYDKDRKEKWTKYLNKSIEKKNKQN